MSSKRRKKYKQLKSKDNQKKFGNPHTYVAFTPENQLLVGNNLYTQVSCSFAATSTIIRTEFTQK